LELTSSRVAEEPASYGFSDQDASAIHYLLWGQRGEEIGVHSYADSFEKWRRNERSNSDLKEIATWRKSCHPYPMPRIALPGKVRLRLHAAYGLSEIKSAFGLADLDHSGPMGVGVMHVEPLKVYIHLVTFKKEDRDFAPTTRYQDYLISRTRLHWESQASTTQVSATGQNYINFKERGYTILFFVRIEKRIDGETSPFVFLGPAADLSTFEGNRPIAMVWDLEHPVPAELFESGRVV
jgi:hypothetical protein